MKSFWIILREDNLKTIILYIILPNIYTILYNCLSSVSYGSDHYFHLKFINSIKENKHKFLIKNPVISNEKYLSYPQLYHWIFSFIPSKFLLNNIKLLNIILRIAEIIILNILLYLFSFIHPFNTITYLYFNVLLTLTPFAYSTWNAKNTGLSARGFGLIIGEVFVFLTVFYIYSGSPLWLTSLIICAYIAILSSQMTFQLILLSAPLYALLFSNFYFLLIPLSAILIFFMTHGVIAVNFFKGQGNHKRNYYFFLAEIFILKNRHSIYRDFVYDFWKRLSKKPLEACLYLYNNPLMEVIIQMPIVAFSVYCFMSGNEVIIFEKILIIPLILFFLTSFRKSRFLGEPQRYIEFFLPVFILYVVLNTILLHLLILFAFSFLVILLNYYLLKRSEKFSSGQKMVIQELIDHLNRTAPLKEYICTSNDNNLLKTIPSLGYKIYKPDITAYFKDKEAFNSEYEGHYSIVSKLKLQVYVNTLNEVLIIFNKNMYSFTELSFENRNNELLYESTDYSVHLLKKV